jgi:DHA2 family multidrug resistance protein
MQNLLGYPIQTAGFLLGSRGVGTLLTMMAAPRLMKLIEPRYLILTGLLITAATLYEMSGWNLNVSQRTIVMISIGQGIGLGLLFVPVTSVAFNTLAGNMRNGATSMTTLLRNIGSSIGISMMIAQLTSNTTIMHARLGEGITPFNGNLQMQDVASNLNLATDTGKAMLDGMITQQAALIAYLNDFKLLMVLTLAMVPLVMLIGTAKKAPGAPKQEEAIHAMD